MFNLIDGSLLFWYLLHVFSKNHGEIMAITSIGNLPLFAFSAPGAGVIQGARTLLVTFIAITTISNLPKADAINPTAAADAFVKVAGLAQESPPIQALCKSISQECHDLCASLSGLKETCCYIACVSAEKMRKLPLSFTKDVVYPVADKALDKALNKVLKATK